ncbi:hypothetical protein CDV31_011086 [Fusarium ambrosium]|uniref:Protein NO VEIN C-terminal domain-containing protein n=1 Tax=Fusarium ambrosium TaxID=131363 RepID=A0A428TIZ0_9HYPO|nr:hypothetical protein CDV31_011086 [Fusarium ambrosium]
MNYAPIPDVFTARRLVEELWSENTVNGTVTKQNSPFGRVIENALTVLSRHLYDKETHFLLELIQNAEDNTYNHNVTPSLSFTYKPGSLRVDCNETGFTESNVRAICKIGESTKAGHGRSARYVGEKGIGFKSIFKITSESEFPEPIRPGYTSFYLRLSGDSNEDRIAHDIQHLDPTMLLFLRRLREINLNVMLIDGKMWTRTLRREDVWTPDGFTTYLHRGPTMSNYIIVKHFVSKLPEDKDRLGVVESEISLAFPPLHETSDGHTHAVYAFLPIRDYGFKVGHFTLSPSFELELIYGKFLLQGDFLLTANREDILDNAWNRALLEACADAFRSTGEPLKATVVYIYERIQADYMNNKKEIRKSFMQKPLIYTSLYSSESDPKMCWITGKECLEKNLDIVKEYESSTTLFRNVLGTGTNAIERRVQSLRAITEDTSLDDIVASFVEMDRLIQALGSQRFKAASEKLNKWFPVFPILKNWNDNEYDELAPLNPPFPPWFIADREHLRDSFCGSVNILAISPRDISSIQIFLEALDLQPRVLSTIVKVESHPLGKPKLHAPYTKSLRRKATFITALIPKQRDGRDTLVEGVFRVEVNIAAEIAQKYTFEYGGRSFSGAEGPGEVALSERSGRLQVFMTRENISATVPPPELGNQICDRYGIVNPSHRNLIHFALGEDSPRRLASTFAREGIHALDPPLGVSDNEFSALSRDEFLDTRATDGEDETQDGGKDKFESKFKYIPTKFLDEIDEEDRRLPLQYFKWSERILFRNTSCDPGTDYRTVLRQEPAHGQYAAEVLTSVFLQQELGSSYKPDDHWTSPQRYKAGYCKFPHPVASYATFTIANREASRKFSDVLAQRGFQDARSWAWANSDPAYHLDMAVSSGGPTSDFSWTSQQFERMRAFRTDRQQKVGWRLKDVHVLVRVSNVFTSPNLDLFVDSWRLFSSESSAVTITITITYNFSKLGPVRGLIKTIFLDRILQYAPQLDG